MRNFGLLALHNPDFSGSSEEKNLLIQLFLFNKQKYGNTIVLFDNKLFYVDTHKNIKLIEREMIKHEALLQFYDQLMSSMTSDYRIANEEEQRSIINLIRVTPGLKTDIDLFPGFIENILSYSEDDKQDALKLNIAGFFAKDSRSRYYIHKSNIASFFAKDSLTRYYIHMPNSLIEYTLKGDQDSVKAILQYKPELVAMKGEGRDYSNRVFMNVSAFQCAVWAGDIRYMCAMMLNCLPDNEQGKSIRKQLAQQYQELKTSGLTYKYCLPESQQEQAIWIELLCKRLGSDAAKAKQTIKQLINGLVDANEAQKAEWIILLKDLYFENFYEKNSGEENSGEENSGWVLGPTSHYWVKEKYVLSSEEAIKINDIEMKRLMRFIYHFIGKTVVEKQYDYSLLIAAHQETLDFYEAFRVRDGVSAADMTRELGPFKRGVASLQRYMPAILAQHYCFTDAQVMNFQEEQEENKYYYDKFTRANQILKEFKLRVSEAVFDAIDWNSQFALKDFFWFDIINYAINSDFEYVSSIIFGGIISEGISYFHRDKLILKSLLVDVQEDEKCFITELNLDVFDKETVDESYTLCNKASK